MDAKDFSELPKEQQDAVRRQLFEHQRELCYICEEPLDLKQPVDVDHIRSKDRGGIASSINNWALTHAPCNRAKSNRDLDLQRYLVRFQKARQKHLSNTGNESTFTVGTALEMHRGAGRDTAARLELEAERETLVVSWEVDGATQTVRLPIDVDLNNAAIKSFTALVPIEHVFHDAGINPRSIVDLEPFIEEFYRGNPQLLPSLAHLTLNSSGRGRVMLFDGQHKAAAQVFLGNRKLYLRVFVNPDEKVLQATNFGAHTKLAQIHFPTAIEDKVGSDIFRPALEDYLNTLSDRHRASESAYFSVLNKEDRSEMRAHFQGYLKFRVVSAVGAGDGQLFKFVETVSARSKTKPLAYETIRKAVFNNFLCLKETSEPIDVALEMRDIERDNLAELLRRFAAKVLVDQFDLKKGIHKIEERLGVDPSIKDAHLRAYRLCRQAPLTVVMRQLRDAIAHVLAMRGRYQDARWNKEQILWAQFEPQDWQAVEKMLDVILSHKVWIERNSDYIRILQDTRHGSWEEILLQGRLPGAAQPVYDKLDHMVLSHYASGVVS